jgi:microsomal dipeptidase-like Zn-dependent dipeptidase
VLSALFPFFSELDGFEVDRKNETITWPAPERGYFEDLREQLDAVNRRLEERHAGEVVVAKTWQGLRDAVDGKKLALVHSVEGGFLLGATAGEIRANVEALADEGIASVTIAHLFYRRVAANVPPLPKHNAIMGHKTVDQWCHEHLPVPSDVGLTELGLALVDALIDNGILIDLTHMTPRAMTETLARLDEADPDKRIPVLVSHGAYRFGTREYCLTDEQIVAIARRNGVIGVIVCRDDACDGLTEKEAVPVVRRHIERIATVLRDAGLPSPGAHVGIGTDLDGFIEPLEGLDTAADLDKLASCVPEDGAQREAFCRGNAYRVLSSGASAGAELRGRVPWAPLPDPRTDQRR